VTGVHEGFREEVGRRDVFGDLAKDLRGGGMVPTAVMLLVARGFGLADAPQSPNHFGTFLLFSSLDLALGSRVCVRVLNRGWGGFGRDIVVVKSPLPS
jgi:hypothetical protein